MKPQRAVKGKLACAACKAKKVRCDLTVRRERCCSRCERSGVCCKVVPGKRQMLQAWYSEVSSCHTDNGTSTTSALIEEQSSPSTSRTTPRSPLLAVSYASPASSAADESVTSFSSSYDSMAHKICQRRQLPQFVEPLSAILSSTVYVRLEQLGCFDMPDRKTIQSLLQGYSRWIHPTLPMVDLKMLTAAWTSGACGRQISFLLLKAMILAGSIVYDSDQPMASGTVQQMEALLEAQVETDSLVVLQVLILMTLIDSRPAGSKGSYHWIGVASKQAARMLARGLVGADSGPSVRATLWSLVTRDTILSLALRQPCQVRMKLAPGMLVVPEQDAWYDAAPLWNEDALIRARTARLITGSELCHSLGEICGASRMTMVSKGGQADPLDSQRAAQRLTCWRIHWHDQLIAVAIQSEDAAIQLHSTIVLGYWSLAVMMLQSPEAVIPASSPYNGAIHSATVSEAMTAITTTYTHLYEHNLVRFIPSSAIAAVVPVAVTHLVNTTTADERMRAANSQRYYLCWQILRDLRHRHPTARHAMSMLDSLGQDLRKTFDGGDEERLARLRSRCNYNVARD